MVVLYNCAIGVVFLSVLLCNVESAEEPLVTLKHGGQLQGITYPVGEQKVDHFVSVRYAKPPVGELRFKKPEPADPWTGVKLAQKGRGVCIQYSFTDEGEAVLGEEDCLFLDVVVPGGASSDGKKPVMVWIHGGGYLYGHRMQYIPAVLATHGDVIVVTINYRLGIFGFLSDRRGNGNFGLWDQRAAIIWVKDNIASFGGDPDMITIFGESAGGGSVVSQMMGQHNDGLFKRAIAESGSLYLPWGWYLSAKDKDIAVEKIKKSLDCEEDVVYDCFKDKSSLEVFESYPEKMFATVFHPVPDEDFFPKEVEESSYELTKRYDLLTGFNGKEGSLFTGAMLGGYLAQMNKSLDDGWSVEDMQPFLQMVCAMLVTKESPELCAYFVAKEYGMEDAEDDFERAKQFAHFAGELNFNEDPVHLLQSHSTGDKATYGYYFLPYVVVPKENQFMSMPAYLKNCADHADELAYLFGVPWLTDDMSDAYKDYIGDMLFKLIISTKENFSDDDKRISQQVMTLWTNFAKSGNPNKPVIVESFPEWREFTPEDKKMIKLHYDSQLIDIPYKERMEIMRSVLLKSRHRRVMGDRPDAQTAAQGQDPRNHDEL